MNDITAPSDPNANSASANEQSVQENDSGEQQPTIAEEDIKRAPVVDVSPTVRVVDADTRNDHLESAPPKAEWYFDENTPGHGEKPDWFNDKTFKTIEEQAKAQNEARKRLGGFTGAPEDGYELDLGENYKDFVFDEEDPLLNNFANMAQEMNMSQEYFNKCVSSWVDNNIRLQEKEKEDEAANWQEELKKLGPTAAEDLKVLNQWSKNALPPELHQSFEKGIKNADMVKIFQTLIDKTIPSQLTHVAPGTGINRVQLRKMMNDPKYGPDPDYTRHVDAEAEALYGRTKIFD
jgi:hypothetical protein